MGNSILDAFNAAASFSQQMMGYQTNKFRERSDKQLKLNHEFAQTNIQNWIRDNPFKGGTNEQEDEQLYKLYQMKLDEYVNTQYTAAGVTNNSKYYQDNLNHIREQVLESSRNYALQSQDAWRRDQDNETLRSTNRRIQTEAENWRRDNPFIGGASKEEDEELYKIYQEKQNTFINELIDNDLMGEHSQYYRETMEKSRGQFHEEYRDIALQSQDAWRRDKDNIELKNAATLIQSAIENHTRDVPYVIGKNEAEDEKTYYEYMEGLTYLIDEQIAIAKNKNDSGYYHQTLDQMRESILAATENYVLGKHDEFRINREFINLDNEIKEIMSNGISSGWDMQTILDAVDNRISLAGTKVELNPRERYEMYNRAAVEVANLNLTKKLNDIDNSGMNVQDSLAAKMAALEEYNKLNLLSPTQEYKYKSDFFNTALDQALNIDIGNMGFKEYLIVLYENLNNFEAAALPYISGKETIDSVLNNKQQQRIEAVKSNAHKVIQDRDYNILDTLDNEWRRAAQDALRAGDQQGILQAQSNYFVGVQLRDAALQGDDFDISYKARIAGMFPVIPGLMGNDESSGDENARRTQIEKILKDNMKGIIQSGIEGTFNDPNERITLYDAQNAFMEHSYKFLTEQCGYTGSINDMRRDFTFVNDFLGDAIKAMNYKGSPYEGHIDSLNILKNYIAEGYKDSRSRFNELFKDQQQILLNKAEQRFWDIFYSSDLSRTNGVELAKRAQDFVDTMVAAELDILRINPNTGISNLQRSGLESEDTAFFRAVYALSRPDAVWTDSLQRIQYNGIDEGNVNEVITAMTSRLAREKGVSVGDIIPVGFTETEGGWDKDGIMEFKLKDDPSKSYRFTAVKNGNRYEGQLEEKAQGSTWKPLKNETGNNSNENANRIVTLASMTTNGSLLPMPPDYEGGRRNNVNDITDRQNYILANYDTYITYLRQYYATLRRDLPEELQQFLGGR